jgi:hypothetical protein
MRCLIQITCFAVMLVTGCACSSTNSLNEASLDKEFVGKEVGELLNYFLVGSEDLEMVDESPGVLCAVSFQVTKGNNVKQFRVWLNAKPRLFSKDRRWDYEAIREARVAKITIERN